MDNTITVNINDLTQEERNQPKKKHKFRAMTIGEHCFDSDSRTMCKDCECGEGLSFCFCTYSVYKQVSMLRDRNKPYKTKDGKYILIEVKE